MAANKKERPVMVTTQHKGVFFGYTAETSGPTVNLRNARMCVYWSSDLRGVLGLAVTGPNTNCKIGPSVNVQLADVTMIAEVTIEAAAKWEQAPWSS